MVPGRARAGRRYDPATIAPERHMPDLSVQIFGHDRDQGTRAAVRFFKERRVQIHQVDLTRKPIARGELRRFVEQARRAGAPRRDLEGVPRRRSRLHAPRRRGDRGAPARDAGAPPAAAGPVRNEVAAGRDETAWKRCSGPARRLSSTATARAARPRRRPGRRAPISAQVESPTMKPMPLSSPVPWPIQTRPAATRMTARSAWDRCIESPATAILAR